MTAPQCMRGFTKVPNNAIPILAEIGESAAITYIALKSFADRDGACWPKLEAVADIAGVSVPTVKRQIKQMAARGLLTKRTRNTHLGRTSSEYRFTDGQSLLVTLGVEIGQSSPVTRGVGVAQSSPVHSPKLTGDPAVTRSTEQEPKKKRKRSMSKKAEKIQLPAELGEGFRETWSEWCRYQREKGKAITPTTARLQLAELAAWGPANAATSIRESMKQGWQGVFRRHQGGNNNGSGHHQPSVINTENETIEEKRRRIFG